MTRNRAGQILAGLFLIPLLAAPTAAQGPGPAGGLRFQFMGPSGGGRVASVSGVPGDTTTWYLGAASGGVWKSTDNGNTFRPVFDQQDAQAIGALAVAPSDPNIVWAGTGEAWAIRDADVMGDGIYKSTDAGATWTNMGLAETGRIGRIIVDPTNAQTVWVCALGRTTGPQEERGVYKTTDGGKTWTRSLFVNPNTGCSGLTMDMHDPNTLFAGMWDVVMHTWAMFSGGPGSGIHVTHDGGKTWTKITDPGLPKPTLGKIDVAVAPTDSKRVYALIQTADQGSVWRSDDGGVHWRAINWQRNLIGRAGYYINIKVSSGNADEVLIACSSFFRSTDGGVNFETVPWGGDTHDIWIDPKNPDHFSLTDDGGAHVTTTHGQSFTTISLPIAQAYHVAVDNQVPYWVYTNRQDDGTMRGPSDGPETPPTTGGHAFFETGGRGGRGARAAAAAAAAADTTGGRGGRGGRGARGGGAGGGGGFGGGRGRGAGYATWDHNLGGCESGFTIPDPTDANIVWATCYGNKVTRYDARLNEARNVEPWFQTLDSPPNDIKYRCHWTAPLAVDPLNHDNVYYGCQVIFKTSNGGQSWSVISPDLSTNDPTRIVSSGGIIGDNLGQYYGEVVFAIAPSPILEGVIWAGTNDGQIWVTKNGGTAWTNVTTNVKGLPAWGTVRQISPSNFDPGTAYVAMDFHMMDNRDPFLYKTTDYGQTWTNVTGDLPKGHPLAYLMSVAENPNRKGMVFAGSGDAFYYTMDDGAHWTQLKAGLPAAPVSWIVVPKAWHDVVVSTYGRGLFILHDITTLEQADQMAGAAVHLYQPRVGYRKTRSGRADITFALKAAPADSVTLEFVDAGGTVVRTMRAAARAGMNHETWDLRGDAPERVALRTTPPDNPHIWDEPRFKGHETRPITHWGIEGAIGAGPLELPGTYTVKLTVDGVTQSQPLEVIKDPAIRTSDADLAASTAMQTRIRDDMTATAGMVNSIEIMRKQIEDLRKADSVSRGNKTQLAALDKKLLDVELILLSKSDMYSDDKWFVEKYHVYLNLIWFNGEVGTGAGDVAGGADYRPTDTQVGVLADIEKDLNRAKAAYATLMKTDVPAFNTQMKGKIRITDTMK